MLVDEVLPEHIKMQLESSMSFNDPLELYIQDLLNYNDAPCQLAVYKSLSSILKSQQLERIDSELTFTNCLQLLHFNNTLEPTSILHQSILNKIEKSFLLSNVAHVRTP